MSRSDCYFAIGKTHVICQDYAVCGSTAAADGGAYAIVADGCSGSRWSDLGARILSRAAEQHLLRSGGSPPDLRAIVRDAAAGTAPLDLPGEALDATLLVAQHLAGTVRIAVAGDGVVVARTRDRHEVRVWSIEFNGEAPAYLSYQLDPRRLAAYRQKGHGLRRLSYLSDRADGRGLVPGPAELSGIADADGDGWVFRLALLAEELELILLLSDGARSFVRRVTAETSVSREPVPLAEVLSQLLALKSFSGRFLVRRCRRLLDRHCPTWGWQHNDDLAAAALYLPDQGGS